MNRPEPPDQQLRQIPATKAQPVRPFRLILALFLHSVALIWAWVCLTSHREAGTWMALAAVAASSAAFVGAAWFARGWGAACRTLLFSAGTLSLIFIAYTWHQSSIHFNDNEQRLVIWTAWDLDAFPRATSLQLLTWSGIVLGGGLVAGTMATAVATWARAMWARFKISRTAALLCVAVTLMVLLQYRRLGGMQETFLFSSTPVAELAALAVPAIAGLWLMVFVPRSGWLAAGLAVPGMVGLCLLLCSVPGLYFSNGSNNLVQWLEFLSLPVFGLNFICCGMLLRRHEAESHQTLSTRWLMASFVSAMVLLTSGLCLARTWDLGELASGGNSSLARLHAMARREGIRLEFWGGRLSVEIQRSDDGSVIERVLSQASAAMPVPLSSISFNGLSAVHDLSFLKANRAGSFSGLSEVMIHDGQISREQLIDLENVPRIGIWYAKPEQGDSAQTMKLDGWLRLSGEAAEMLEVVEMIEIGRSTGVLEVFAPYLGDNEGIDLAIESLAGILERVSRPGGQLKLVVNGGFGGVPDEKMIALLSACEDASRVEIRIPGHAEAWDAAFIDFVVQRGGRTQTNFAEYLNSAPRLARWMQAMLAAPGRLIAPEVVDPDWAAQARHEFRWEQLARMHCLPDRGVDPEGLVTVLAPAGVWLSGLDATELASVGRLMVGPSLLLGDRAANTFIPAGILPAMSGLQELHCEAIDVRMAGEIAQLAKLRVLRPGIVGEQRDWRALTAAITNLSELETLVVGEIPDLPLIRSLAGLPKFRRLVLLSDEPPPNTDVEQLGSLLPGVTIECLTPAQAEVLEPAVLRNHRARMRREVLDWLAAEGGGSDHPSVQPVDD